MKDTMTTTLARWDAGTGGGRRHVDARDGMELDALLPAGEVAGSAEGAQA